MKVEEFTDAQPGDRFKIEFEVRGDGYAWTIAGGDSHQFGVGCDTGFFLGAEVLDLVRAPPTPARETWVLEDVPLPCIVVPGDIITTVDGDVFLAGSTYETSPYEGRVQRRVNK